MSPSNVLVPAFGSGVIVVSVLVLVLGVLFDGDC
jgi:hypothetical protein